MNIKELPYPQRIAAMKYLRKENKAHPSTMQEFPVPPGDHPRAPFAAWRSRGFLAQAYRDGGIVRLSVNRTEVVAATGDWTEGITWDELMAVKRECGFSDRWAVEVYPPDASVVNVANIRHLFLLDGPPEYGWKKNTPPTP